jgi:hypothetical protein
MLFALGLSVCIASIPLAAHHGNAAYDTEKTITLKGTVTQWFWANPHCVLELDAKSDSGEVVHWSAETENPTTMSHQGWMKSSFKPGDQVTVTVITVKNGKPIGRIIEAVTANGQKLAGRIVAPLPAYNPEPPKQ